MNKLFILVAIMAIALMAVPAFADDCDTTFGYVDTSGASYDNPIFNQWLNHTHGVYIDQRRNPAGVGVDAVLYQSNSPLLEEVTAEYRYDINNDEHITYAVARVNVFSAVKGLFK